MTYRSAHVRRLTSFVVAIPLVLGGAGCGDDDDATASGEGDGQSGSSGELSIEITEPTDGDAVPETFDMAFDMSVPVGEPDTGLHHVHVYYDGETAEGNYDLVYEESFTVERDLAPGDHEIEAVLANADHSLTDARQTINVTIEQGGNGGGGDDTDTTPTTTDPYDY